MTAKRRVAAVERSLTAQEVVLQILGEMREFASLEDYTRTLIDKPEELAPLNRIDVAAETSVRAAMKARRATRSTTRSGRRTPTACSRSSSSSA